MTTEPITLEETIAILSAGVEEIGRLVARIPGGVDDLLRGGAMPPAVREFVVDAATGAVTTITSLLEHLDQLLTGAAAPVRFVDLAYRWETVRGVTSGVTGALDPDLMPAAGTWAGDAADAYDRAAGPQRDATERLTTLITKIDGALTTCVIAGCAFYTALAAAVGLLLAHLAAALLALVTGVGAPVAVVELVGGAGTATFLIMSAVSTLSALLVAQAAEMTALHGEAVDRSTFPGGHWPDPITRTYSDATVTDGDATWSLRH